MKLSQLKTGLALHPDKAVRFVLPTGSAIPPHAHISEVARISKHFVDCGGVRGEDSFCRMQTWHADCLAQDRCGVPPTSFQALAFKPISRKP